MNINAWMTVEQGVMRIGESFSYNVPGYAQFCWSISRAKYEALDPANVEFTAEVPREQLTYIAANNDFDEAHLARVDITQPGIAAPLKSPPEFGGQVTHILIDGTHRAINALRTGQPFYARILTVEAGNRCLMTGDDRLKVKPEDRP